MTPCGTTNIWHPNSQAEATTRHEEEIIEERGEKRVCEGGGWSERGLQRWRERKEKVCERGEW